MRVCDIANGFRYVAKSFRDIANRFCGFLFLQLALLQTVPHLLPEGNFLLKEGFGNSRSKKPRFGFRGFQSVNQQQAHGLFRPGSCWIRHPVDKAVLGRSKLSNIIVKMDLAHKPDPELKQYSQNYMDKLAKTTAFPTLTAGATAYKALHDGFSTALGNSDQANQVAKQMTLLKDTARGLLEAAITQNGHTVEGTTGVTADMALSVGFETKGTGAPVGKLPQVENLSLTTGDKPGDVDSHWNSVRGSHGYEHMHCTSDPAVEANWNLVEGSTGSKATHSGLASGSRLWSRVRAKAPKREHNGPWSQPATIIVP